MRAFLLALLLVAPLSAQHIAASNQSDRTPASPLQVWEEAVAVMAQADWLHDALSSGEQDFDISADACLSIRAQQRSGFPPALPTPIKELGSNTADCEVLLTEDYVKEALHGWQWDFPASTGADHTVCASGCDFTNLETAIAAASCGDTVTVTANETVALGTNNITVAHACTEANPLWIRTSAHANAAFTLGSRITLDDTALLPKFTLNPNAGLFDITNVLIGISSVNTGTDTLTMASPHGLSVGDEVYFTTGSTQPLSDLRPYWVLTVPSSTTLTVSKFENAGAATLDITGTATGSLVLPASWIRLTGFYPDPTASGDNSSALAVDMVAGASAYAPNARPHHIWMDHFLTDEGVFNQEQRRIFNIAGRWVSVTDSYIDGAQDNSDSQAIWVNSSAAGPIWIENNYLSATGENIMLGGSAGANVYTHPGSNGLIVIKGNHWYKDPSRWKHTIVAGAPTTPCLPGEKWNNTSAGTYHVCDAGGASWSASTVGVFPDTSLIVKNIFESKRSAQSLNTGNVYDTSWADAQDFPITIKQGGYDQNGINVTFENVVFYGEILKHAPNAIQIAGFTGSLELDNPDGLPFDPGPAWVWNMLFYDINADLYDQQDDTTFNLYPWSTGSVPQGVLIDHVTQLTSPGLVSASKFRPSSAFLDIEPLIINNSILAIGDFIHDSTTAGCLSLTKTTDTGNVDNSLWVWVDGAGPNMSACATNFYDETDTDDVGFSNWTTGTTPADFRLSSAGTTADYRAGGAQDAADGKDMGADTEIIADLTGGAEAGLLSWSEQFGVAISAVGTTTATVEWDRPNSANACNFYLYSNYARTTEHADTSGDNGDNRDGGVAAGHATFNLGTNAALTTKTWYWFEIDCPTDSVRMVGSLFTN